jgi:hypothetical protein
LNHIRSRQEQYGPDEGFKFHSYLNRKDVVEAQYGRNGNTEKAAERNKKQQMTRKKKREDIAKGKKKGKKSVGLAAGLAAGLAQSMGAVAAEDTAATEDTAANGRTAANGNTTAIEGTAGDDFQTTFELQIDPALLGDEGSALVQIPVANDTQQHHESGGYIDDIGMRVLIANGFPNSIPVNGPQDGPP